MNFTAKIRKRDSVTFLIRSTLWPRIYIAWRVTALNPIKNRPFFQQTWRDRAIGLIYYGNKVDVKFGMLWAWRYTLDLHAWHLRRLRCSSVQTLLASTCSTRWCRNMFHSSHVLQPLSPRFALHNYQMHTFRCACWQARKIRLHAAYEETDM